MSSSDSSDHEDEFDEIRCYFPPQEWESMCNYEKRSFVNAAENYQAMIRAGLNPRKPNFMLNDLERSNLGKPPPKLYQPRKPKEPKLSDNAPEHVRASPRLHEKFNLEEDSKNGTKDVKQDVLYCDECHRDWMGDCPKHGPLKVVADTKVPAGGALGCVRAAATLPPGLSLELAARAYGGAPGVWATTAVPRRTLFGPYEGDPVASKAATSNWMGLVRAELGASKVDAARANLRAFEYCGRLHFRTTRDIPAGGELLVKLGAKESSCEHCGARFSCTLLLAQHQRAAEVCAVSRREQRREQVDYNKARVVYDVRVLERSEAARQLRREEAARRQITRQNGIQASRKWKRRSETMERLRQKQLINDPEMARWRERQERKLQRRRQRLHRLRFEQARAVVALERAMDETAAQADEDANGGSGGSSAKASAGVAEDTGSARLRCTLCAADSAPAFRRLFQLRFHLAAHADEQMAAVPATCPKCFLEPAHRRSHRHLRFFCLACGVGFGGAKPLRDHVMQHHAADADVVLPPDDDDLLSSEDNDDDEEEADDDDVVEVKQEDVEDDEGDVVEVKEEVLGRGYPDEEGVTRKQSSVVAWPAGSPPVVVKEEVVEWDAAAGAVEMTPEVMKPEMKLNLDPEVNVKIEPVVKDEMDDGEDTEVKMEQVEMAL